MSWDLRPHEKTHYRTSQVPIIYDPTATAPRFQKFLSEIFEKDGEVEARRKAILICEMFGYCLLSSTKFEKFFMLVGPGANGKSVLLNLLVEFLGRENVSAVSPAQLDNKFQRAHLLGKLANVVTELPQGTTLPDEAMKSITSGETMTVELKYKPAFEFRPYSTIVIATNHLPHTRDFSDATFRRVIIIPFNRVFSESEQDKTLLEKLKAELPGILNLSLAALEGVFRRGYFTETTAIEKMKKQWRLESDQAAQYVADCCELEAGATTLSNEMYQNYQRWAKQQGINKILNQNNFSKRLKVLGAEPTKGTGGVRELAGIKIVERISSDFD